MSEYVQEGHLIWVDKLARKYRRDTVLCMVVDADEESIEVDVVDDWHQPIGERYMITYDQIESSADTLTNLITTVRNLPCVSSTIQTVKTAISNAVHSVGAYLAAKLYHFPENGWVKLALGFGASWRGKGLLPHSLRAEGGLGVILWPSHIAGTITHELCLQRLEPPVSGLYHKS